MYFNTYRYLVVAAWILLTSAWRILFVFLARLIADIQNRCQQSTLSTCQKTKRQQECYDSRDWRAFGITLQLTESLKYLSKDRKKQSHTELNCTRFERMTFWIFSWELESDMIPLHQQSFVIICKLLIVGYVRRGVSWKAKARFWQLLQEHFPLLTTTRPSTFSPDRQRIICTGSLYGDGTVSQL